MTKKPEGEADAAPAKRTARTRGSRTVTAKIQALTERVGQLQQEKADLVTRHREELARQRDDSVLRLQDERGRMQMRISELRDSFDTRLDEIRRINDERYFGKSGRQGRETTSGPFELPADLPPLPPAPPGRRGLAIRVKDATLTFRRDYRRQSIRTALSLMLPWVSRQKPPSAEESEQRYFNVRGVSFDIRAGERVAIIGAHRAGKSSLLRLLSGVFAPDTGSVRVYRPMTPFLALGAGFMPMVTVAENATFNMALHRLSRRAAARALEEVLVFAGLADKRQWSLFDLEPEEKRRLAIACALHVEGDILLFDGPPVSRDPGYTRLVMERMRERLATRTLIMAGYSQPVFRALQVERALLLHEGELIFDGPLDEGFVLLAQKLDDVRAASPFAMPVTEEDEDDLDY